MKTKSWFDCFWMRAERRVGGGEGDSSGWETDDTDTFEGVTRGGDIDSERAFDHLATMLRYRLSCLRTCNTVISCRGKHSLLLYVEWLFVV